VLIFSDVFCGVLKIFVKIMFYIFIYCNNLTIFSYSQPKLVLKNAKLLVHRWLLLKIVKISRSIKRLFCHDWRKPNSFSLSILLKQQKLLNEIFIQTGFSFLFLRVETEIYRFTLTVSFFHSSKLDRFAFIV